jgi:hypothetical protein
MVVMTREPLTLASDLRDQVSGLVHTAQKKVGNVADL